MAFYRISLAVLAVLMVRSAGALDNPAELGNWFNDPFFQVRSAIADCPIPIGPLTTREQARQQEHYRAERGTSCYLSGECKKPNAYFYDAEIGSRVRQIFADQPHLLEHSAVWVTVSRRFVYVEGCSAENADLATLDEAIRSVPDVQTVLLNIAKDAKGHLPYQALKPNRP